MCNPAAPLATALSAPPTPHAPQRAPVGVVPVTAESESDAVAKVIRGAEHRPWGDDDSLGKAGLKQRQRIDTAWQFRPQDQTSHRVGDLGPLWNVLRDQCARFVHAQREGRTHPSVDGHG